MNAATNQQAASGGCLMFPIFIVFLVLKLSGTVTWSWWLITLPLWLPFGLFLLVGLLFILVSAIARR